MHPVEKIRNVAIVAHIDHGKTTLIDAIFKATRTFRENARVEERVMDSNELEKERGITIRAKHCTVEWGDYLFNIIDTPGHADFSGEVERVLSMVDSVVLLVDANEGPMPQTRYVTMRSLALGHKPLVIVNKVERPNADPSGALDKTFDLFLELGADDHQADFPVLYGSGLQGWLVNDLDTDPPDQGLGPFFQALVDHVPPPAATQDAPFRMQACTLAWNDFVGRIGCGRILEGTLRKGQTVRQVSTRFESRESDAWSVLGEKTVRIGHLWVTRGLERVEVEEAGAGDIVWLNGPEEIGIGDTFLEVGSDATPLPPLEIEEPTVSMFFLVNSGPFSGQQGRAVTVRELRDRIERELRQNVALTMEELEGRADGLKVSGRGELHLAILIEEMRREGMEFCVSRPEVITHQGPDGEVLEPFEDVMVDVPDEHQGTVISSMAPRKGEMVEMQATGQGSSRLRFRAPTRGLIGYRTDFLTETRGLGVMARRFVGYHPWCGEIPSRSRGSMISMETGEVTGYALENLQQRGTLFVKPGQRVYSGQVVGECARPGDLPCNPTKRKQVTNHRSANKEIDTVLKTPRDVGLDMALEWIANDELVEVTPEAVRVRKSILDAEDRKRAEKQAALGG